MREDVARYIARIKDTDYHDLCLGVLDEYGEAYFTARAGSLSTTISPAAWRHTPVTWRRWQMV